MRHRPVVANRGVSKYAVSTTYQVVRIKKSNSAYGYAPYSTAITLWGTSRVVAMSSIPFNPTIPEQRASGLVRTAHVPNFYSRLRVPRGEIGYGNFRGQQVLRQYAVLVSSRGQYRVGPRSVRPMLCYPIPRAIYGGPPCRQVVTIWSVTATTRVMVVSVQYGRVVGVIVGPLGTGA